MEELGEETHTGTRQKMRTVKWLGLEQLNIPNFGREQDLYALAINLLLLQAPSFHILLPEEYAINF